MINVLTFNRFFSFPDLWRYRPRPASLSVVYPSALHPFSQSTNPFFQLMTFQEGSN